MEATLAEQFGAYRATYSQDVRDVVETFCVSTTRMTGGAPGRVSIGALRSIALTHDLNLETLSAALADFSTIELQAELAHRRGNRPTA